MPIFVSVLLLLLVGVSAQQPQCPDFRLIQPCNCQTDNNVVSMVCSNLQSVEQLKRIFEPVYPTTNLWHLTVKNSHLEELETNLFSEKSFAVILFQNITGLFRIQPHAFAASVDRLRVLTIDSSPLAELSVAGIADLENLIDFEVTTSVDQLTDFPSLPNLQYLHLYGNRFISPPELPFLPKLHSLWLNSGKLTTVRPLNITLLPSLRKLVLFGNQLRRLEEGDLHFDSPKVDLIDLSDNPLDDHISPNAIRGITFNTVLDMKKTNLTFLDEATFKPLLTTLLKGTGFIQLLGTMLQCDSMCWLLADTKLLAKISHNTKCTDGLSLFFKSTRLPCPTNTTNV